MQAPAPGHPHAGRAPVLSCLIRAVVLCMQVELRPEQGAHPHLLVQRSRDQCGAWLLRGGSWIAHTCARRAPPRGGVAPPCPLHVCWGTALASCLVLCSTILILTSAAGLSQMTAPTGHALTAHWSLQGSPANLASPSPAIPASPSSFAVLQLPGPACGGGGGRPRLLLLVRQLAGLTPGPLCSSVHHVAGLCAGLLGFTCSHRCL